MSWTRGQLVGAVLWAAVLTVSFVLYRSEHALAHFAWHLGYGSAAGLLAAAGWMFWCQRPSQVPHLWALGGYLYMVVPDLLWLAPQLVGRPPWPHAPWMDVFLGHVSLDRWAWTSEAMVPVLVVAVGAYLWARQRQRPTHPGGTTHP